MVVFRFKISNRMPGYYPDSNAKRRGSNLDNFYANKVCTKIYIETSMHTDEHTNMYTTDLSKQFYKCLFFEIRLSFRML